MSKTLDTTTEPDDPRPTAVRKPRRRRVHKSALPAPTSIETLRQIEQRAARDAVTVGFDEMARYLQDHLGQKLTAYLAGLKDVKSVGQWATGQKKPPAITRERLRAAYQSTRMLEAVYSDEAAQGWFFGAHETLDDRAPAAVLRTAETPDEMTLVTPLARAFIRGAAH